MSPKESAPWIGMPAQMDPGGSKQYLNREYPDAVTAAGGVPIIVPLSETASSIESIAEQMDGILLTGSNSDLDPSLYNAVRLDSCGPVQPLRDRMDFFLMEIAVKRRLPVLAICYGMQSLNVFFGGSLIQDINASIDTSIEHNKPRSKDMPNHPIDIVPESVLESLAGGDEAMVNSTHHQAVERPGEGLDVTAYAPDGIVESVCGSNRSHWILGVQWHPESMFAGDDFSRKIFDEFLAHCRVMRGTHARAHT
jgi:putative glutamine amidotransferase